MPVYPQEIYRAIDRKWLDRTTRGKLGQPLQTKKVLASTLKERAVQRKRKRITKNRQLVADGRLISPIDDPPSAFQGDLALTPVKECGACPEANSAAPDAVAG